VISHLTQSVWISSSVYLAGQLDTHKSHAMTLGSSAELTASDVAWLRSTSCHHLELGVSSTQCASVLEAPCMHGGPDQLFLGDTAAATNSRHGSERKVLSRCFPCQTFLLRTLMVSRSCLATSDYVSNFSFEFTWFVSLRAAAV
jgi:hypothetical protein